MTKYAGPIVITGMGAVSPFGLGADAVWSALLKGERREMALEAQGADGHDGHDGQPIWGMKVGAWQPADLLGKRGLQYLRPSTQFLLGASLLALQKAGLTSGETNPDELGITVGCNLVGAQSIIDYDYTAITESPHDTSPMEAPNTLANAPASHLAIRLKARALNTTISSGQCASLDALGYAVKMLRDARARQILAGGVEELSATALWFYHNAQVVSSGAREDAGRPFCTRSSGWLPSEGAAAILLERQADAQARGARPLAELAGWSSAFATSQLPEKRANTLRRVAQRALDSAGLSSRDIDVVVSGAGGLVAQDQAEALALRDLLEANEHTIVTAVKGTLGEIYGASGLFLALAAVCMIDTGMIPPTYGGGTYEHFAPTARRQITEIYSWSRIRQRTVLSLTQDIFGSTSAVVIRGCQD